MSSSGVTSMIEFDMNSIIQKHCVIELSQTGLAVGDTEKVQREAEIRQLQLVVCCYVIIPDSVKKLEAVSCIIFFLLL